jgi:hypothetical protein
MGLKLLWVNHYHGECSKPPKVLRSTSTEAWGDSPTEVLAFLVLFPLINLSLISFSHKMCSKTLS